jgi:putative spermidine/putrescine transport system ATP-binding protein
MTQSSAPTLSREMSRDSQYLELSDVTKRYGSVTVLDRLSAAVGQGEFVSLLGPSGCGKTTLLRLIAGLLHPDGGTIAVGGRDLTRIPAHKRNIGVVFQSYALFPHLDVAQNVAFGLEAQGVPSGEIAGRVREALALVRMEGFADRRISALSGGQQQRIAVARALVVRPSLLLLDEPFSALDRNLRETMQIELRDLLRRQRITSIFVTHDQDEALVMSDRIAVMNAGRIEHFGTPSEVYRHPQTPFVLDFVGQSTRLTGTVSQQDKCDIRIETSIGTIRAPGDLPVGSRVLVGIRPELIDIDGQPGDRVNTVRLPLRDAVYLGSKTMLYFRTQGAEDRVLCEVPRLVAAAAPGTEMMLAWPVSETMVFPCP